MKTRETTPGKTYSVHTMKGCTIIEPDGWQKTIEAPDGYFDAHFGSVVIDGDDAADIRELFKLAPYQKLRLLGVVGGGVPAWLKALETELTALLDGSKFELAWLAGEKKLVVHTDRVSDELLAAVKATAEAAMPEGAVLVQYNHNIEVSWRDIDPELEPMLAGKYEECKTLDDIIAVDENYLQDVTPSGAWSCLLTNFESNNGKSSTFGKELTAFNVPLPKLATAHGLFSKAAFRTFKWPLNELVNARQMFSQSSLEFFDISLPKATDVFQMFFYNANLKFIRTYIPKGSLHCFCNESKKLEEVECDLGQKRNLTADQAFENCTALKKITLGDTGISNLNRTFNLCKSLSELYATFSSLSGSLSAFNGCILNADSALRVLNSIPSYTSGEHQLTIGIHVDLKTDDEVLAAIANAESKGWAMTVQWNGTPTAQASVTYGLRNSPIYAKVSETERSDGTTERVLDWGHYVTDETGYEVFRSVEAAREYFGLPDEPLTETE
jgi:hypothetical protein